MLEHLQEPANPSRVVVVGARGFVGSAVTMACRAQGMDVLALGRDTLDLEADGAEDRLAGLTKPGDALVFVSAIAPCRDPAQLVRNLTMARTVAGVLARSSLAHVVNIGSDAVYADADALVSETTPPSPGNLHGIMHLAREIVLKGAAAKTPLALLRPSLLYGAHDPHNGYGPNRFRRLAAQGKPITLFGGGEEKRDHVFVDDAGALVAEILRRRSTGALNVATGASVSFREAAELVASLFGRVPIQPTPRQNPIVHRHFDPTARLRAFPRFPFAPLSEGMARTRKALLET